jgi:uncharacterized repeat protein (TIGR03803 family)
VSFNQFRRWHRLALVILALSISASAEWKEKVLHSFQGTPDGAGPAGGVVFDAAGNLYGATTDGGAFGCAPTQCGTVFQVAAPAGKGGAWTETVLYIFKGNASGDGNTPVGGLVIDRSGNLYGTTAYGGTGSCVLFGGTVGCGTVFELSPPAQQGGAWTETVLYSFQGSKDGDFPSGDLVFDSTGNLYGATQYGGGYGSCNAPFFLNCGTVFELSPPQTKGSTWTEQVLYSFKGTSAGELSGDGANPNGGLLLDSKGIIYGTTSRGGINSVSCTSYPYYFVGCGIVFKLSPAGKRGGSWKTTVLYRFKGYPDDGSALNGNLIFDVKGSLYGTTLGGGSQEEGVAFKLSPPAKKAGFWTETLPHVFTGGADGASPITGVRLDSVGNLYGTSTGGTSHGGLVYQMKPPVRQGGEWDFVILYKFSGLLSGYTPIGISFVKADTIGGTTEYGGSGQACQGDCGTVFEVTP